MKSQINPHVPALDPGALIFPASVGAIGAKNVGMAAFRPSGSDTAAPELAIGESARSFAAPAVIIPMSESLRVLRFRHGLVERRRCSTGQSPQRRDHLVGA
jgi:hypothetical protein